MRVRKTAGCLLGLMLLSGMFFSCAKGNTAKAETTLKIYLFGESQNLDKILVKFYEQTKNTLNTKLDIIWSSAADHREKIPLMMSNQEDCDLVFDAYWMNLNRLASQGAYANVASYFNNDNYPGLKKAFPPGYIAQVTNADGSIYAIPFTQAAEDIMVIFLRKDLREKYGMAPISSNEELETYFKKVKAEIQAGSLDMVAPFGVAGTRAFYYLDDDIIEKRTKNVLSVDGSGFSVGIMFDVAISQDKKKVLGAATLGDPDSAWTVFPDPYNVNTRNRRIVNDLIKWAQYIQRDAQTEKDAKKNLFFAEKVAAMEGNISNYTEISRVMEDLGKSVEMYVYNPTMQNGGKVVTQPLTAWNFLCVPQQSKKIEQTMKFLDWLFLDRANHDLFELGIEGEDWKAHGADEYQDLTAGNKYTFPGYEMTWNPNYIRTNASYPENVKALFKYQNSPDNYLPSVIPGFTFNNEATGELRTAYAAVVGVQTAYHPILMLGLSGTPERAQAVLDEYYTKAKNAGLDIVRKAVIDQVQAYLDTRYK